MTEQRFDLVTAERHALADLLERLTPEQWSTPSLCAGWTVKDVAAHTMVGPTASLRELTVAMVRARGDFDRANLRLTAARSSRSTQELVALVREHAESRFTPPTFDWRAPLTDLLVHREDIVRPLGLLSDRPLEAWRLALDFLVTPKARSAFLPAPLPDVRLTATDLDWSHGAGAEVSGAAASLAMAVTGRPPRPGDLTGPGAETLRSWVN